MPQFFGPARARWGHGPEAVEPAPHGARAAGPGEHGACSRGHPAWRPHSMSWSARTNGDGGTVRPSSLAVFRLMMSSYLVGSSTGISAGRAPFRILSTTPAFRRSRSVGLGPNDIKPPPLVTAPDH